MSKLSYFTTSPPVRNYINFRLVTRRKNIIVQSMLLSRGKNWRNLLSKTHYSFSYIAIISVIFFHNNPIRQSGGSIFLLPLLSSSCLPRHKRFAASQHRENHISQLFGNMG